VDNATLHIALFAKNGSSYQKKGGKRKIFSFSVKCHARLRHIYMTVFAKSASSQEAKCEKKESIQKGRFTM